MTTVWATPADVRARWPGAPGDDALIAAWIADAETIIAAEFPWVAEDGPDPEQAATLGVVVVRMVIRALSTPFGIRQESVGDTSLAYTDSESLYLTDADRALIAGYGPQVAYTVDQSPRDDGLPRDWRWWWARGWDDEADYFRWIG